jgi:hypothetical protein
MTRLTLRPELDELRCDHPRCDECDGLTLEGTCHPGSPVWATYTKGGELSLECSKCDTHILTVMVAG